MHSLITTSDGSHSIYVSELDEHYHSIHGAIRESRHVYIEAGMNSLPGNEELRILEMGLGTGLNVLLTLIESAEKGRKVNFTSIEAFPLPLEIIETLNYTKIVGLAYADIFRKIHLCPWETVVRLENDFYFKKIRTTLQQLEPESKYDLIYFDAFGPRVQPELWVQEIFEKMFKALGSGGILVTYCAQGQVKRNMKSAGFIVETLPGPPHKREMIRGRK